MVASTFWPSASLTSPKTTFAPSRTNVSASAAPCPRAPPLISATLPSSFPIGLDVSWPSILLRRGSYAQGSRFGSDRSKGWPGGLVEVYVARQPILDRFRRTYG